MITSDDEKVEADEDDDVGAGTPPMSSMLRIVIFSGSGTVTDPLLVTQQRRSEGTLLEEELLGLAVVWMLNWPCCGELVCDAVRMLRDTSAKKDDAAAVDVARAEQRTNEPQSELSGAVLFCISAVK